jgi:ribonuclease HI
MWVDGGSRGNPGPAAVGYRIEDDAGEVLDEAGEAIGVATNNEAEYRALITALERAAVLGAREVEVRADSELLLRQMTGRYKVKSPHLRELWHEAQGAAGAFDRVDYVEVRRTENTDADRQVNLALDEA